MAALAKMLPVGITGEKWRGEGREGVGRLNYVPKGLLAEGLGTHSYGGNIAVAKKENVQIWAG